MSYTETFGQKGHVITASRIDLFTDIRKEPLVPYLNGVPIGTTADVSFTAVGSTPNANGASVASDVITLQPADATHPGLTTAVAQTIGGAKTFAAAPILSTGVFGNTPSSPQFMTINASGVLGSQAAAQIVTSGTVTATPTVDTGAITSYQTRGVGSAQPIVNWTLTTQAGVPSRVEIRVPAVQVTAVTGSPTTILVTGASPLPSSIWPGICCCQ